MSSKLCCPQCSHAAAPPTICFAIFRGAFNFSTFPAGISEAAGYPRLFGPCRMSSHHPSLLSGRLSEAFNNLAILWLSASSLWGYIFRLFLDNHNGRGVPRISAWFRHQKMSSPYMSNVFFFSTEEGHSHFCMKCAICKPKTYRHTRIGKQCCTKF